MLILPLLLIKPMIFSGTLYIICILCSVLLSFWPSNSVYYPHPRTNITFTGRPCLTTQFWLSVPFMNCQGILYLISSFHFHNDNFKYYNQVVFIWQIIIRILCHMHVLILFYSFRNVRFTAIATVHRMSSGALRILIIFVA